MDTKKVASFFKDARSIWVGIFMLITAASWAGNLQWVTKEDYSKDQVIQQVRQLNNDISELKIRSKYTTEQSQKRMFESLMIHKENQIKNLKEGLSK